MNLWIKLQTLKPMDLFISLKKFIDERVKENGGQYQAFGIFGLFNYPIYYFIWLYASPQTYESFTLRLIATILCLGLVLQKRWPKKLVPIKPIYWYCTLLYCLPFFFTFMLIKNHGSAMWITNTIVIVFFLMLLVDWLSCIILLSMGSILGILFGYLALGSDLPVFKSSFDYSGFLITYLVSIVIGVIFAHNKQVIEQKKLGAMKSVGTSVAHELRTPLATVREGINGIKSYLPSLVEAYSLAESHGLPIKKIRPDSLYALNNLLDIMKNETLSAFHFIDMFLVNVKETTTNQRLEICFIGECIKKAMLRYPFQLGQREFIHLDTTNDFAFHGNELLMLHIIFNLLKNALYYISVAGKGEISIWMTQGEHINKLHFKDTSTGISSKNLSRIFERFYSNTPHGTGIGLTYCRMVMQLLGGDIFCSSVEGEFTEFILHFPLIH